MTVYFDTSALVKLYVREVGSRRVRDWMGRATMAASSRGAYPEARAAFARRHREGGLSVAGLRRAVIDLDRDMGSFVTVELAHSVARRAGELAERHALRGFDAIHLASALELGHLLGEGPTFLAFDERLVRAAAAEELRVG